MLSSDSSHSFDTKGLIKLFELNFGTCYLMQLCKRFDMQPNIAVDTNL